MSLLDILSVILVIASIVFPILAVPFFWKRSKAVAIVAAGLGGAMLALVGGDIYATLPNLLQTSLITVIVLTVTIADLALINYKGARQRLTVSLIGMGLVILTAFACLLPPLREVSLSILVAAMTILGYQKLQSFCCLVDEHPMATVGSSLLILAAAAFMSLTFVLSFSLLLTTYIVKAAIQQGTKLSAALFVLVDLILVAVGGWLLFPQVQLLSGFVHGGTIKVNGGLVILIALILVLFALCLLVGPIRRYLARRWTSVFMVLWSLADFIFSVIDYNRGNIASGQMMIYLVFFIALVVSIVRLMLPKKQLTRREAFIRRWLSGRWGNTVLHVALSAYIVWLALH